MNGKPSWLSFVGTLHDWFEAFSWKQAAAAKGAITLFSTVERWQPFPRLCTIFVHVGKYPKLRETFTSSEVAIHRDCDHSKCPAFRVLNGRTTVVPTAWSKHFGQTSVGLTKTDMRMSIDKEIRVPDKIHSWTRLPAFVIELVDNPWFWFVVLVHGYHLICFLAAFTRLFQFWAIPNTKFNQPTSQLSIGDIHCRHRRRFHAQAGCSVLLVVPDPWTRYRLELIPNESEAISDFEQHKNNPVNTIFRVRTGCSITHLPFVAASRLQVRYFGWSSIYTQSLDQSSCLK